jgi:hypothetical protein
MPKSLKKLNKGKKPTKSKTMKVKKTKKMTKKMTKKSKKMIIQKGGNCGGGMCQLPV